MSKKYTINFDKNGNPFKSNTAKIPCGISDQYVLAAVILGVIFGILDIVGMLIKN